MVEQQVSDDMYRHVEVVRLAICAVGVHAVKETHRSSYKSLPDMVRKCLPKEDPSVWQSTKRRFRNLSKLLDLDICFRHPVQDHEARKSSRVIGKNHQCCSSLDGSKACQISRSFPFS